MRTVQLAGIVQGTEEINAVNRVLGRSWQGTGPECASLQAELALYANVRRAVVVNSGSMANLLALLALDLPRGSKVLTSGGGFPATLNPILHLGHEPVLVDYHLPSHNVDTAQIVSAIQAHHNLKAVIVAHTLGNPLDMPQLLEACQNCGIALIEDCCEAIGSKLGSHVLGSFGTAGTMSFYPSHQMNGFGGGGVVLTDRIDLADKITSLRDWGKVPTREGDQVTRFGQNVDGIPYDQQYTYQTVGFNARFPDANCAYAREQLKKLDGFNTTRKQNYHFLDQLLEGLPLVPMRWHKDAEPAFFAYPLTLHPDSPHSRDEFVQFMEAGGVRTRLFFAGNITRHLPYNFLRTELPVADYLMKRSFFVGCWHGLTTDDMEFTAERVHQFFC